MKKSFLFTFKGIISIVLVTYLFGCGDDTTTSPGGGYQYTVIDSLFFQKDYDSVYTYRVLNLGYEKKKLKKFKVSYDLSTNDTTDTTAVMSFNISDGQLSYGQTQSGSQCNGHFEYEYEFNKVLDSIQIAYYNPFIRGQLPNGVYLVVRNLKAYKSY